MAIIACPDCNKDLSDAAPACLNCGRPSVTKARHSLIDRLPRKPRKSRWALAFLMIIIPCSLLGWLFLGRGALPTTTDMAIKDLVEKNNTERSVFLTTAPELVADYVQNEVSADNFYKGKIVQIEGVVTSIKKDLMDRPYVTLDGGRASRYRSVQAFFDQSMNAILGSLRKGQVIAVRCRVDGLSVNVLARDCAIHR